MLENQTTEDDPLRMEDTQKLPETMLQNMGEADSSNNNPDIQLNSQNLGIDEFLADRLTHKPPEKYKFRRSIACGGMKIVLEVRDMDTMRDVAMAVLPDAQTRPPVEILRFVQEARLTASLEHPNIVPVHDIGIDSNGSPYFTMKLLRGKTLAAYLRSLQESPGKEKPYPLPRLLRIYLKICSGIAFAHSKGVLHLDLKPENIQLGDFGEVLIIDWGLAKMIHAANDDEKETAATDTDGSGIPLVTMNGVAKGTPGYMAPEQAAGQSERKDERTDIYALGAILYAMLTGKNPIEKKPVRQMLEDTVNGAVIPPHLRVPEREIPAALEAVVMKAMSRNPADRYSSVMELRDEVNAFIGGYATAAEKASPLKKIFLLTKRHLMAVIFTIMIIAFVSMAVWQIYRDQKRRNAAWHPVCEAVFQTKQPAPVMANGLFFLDQAFQQINWYSGKNGILIPANQWLLLTCPVNHSWRLELQLIPETNTENFEIRLQTAKRQSSGFLCQFGADGGKRDVFFRRNESQESLAPISGAPCCLISGSVRRILIQQDNGKLTIRTGTTEKSLCLGDFMPPDSNAGEQISLRAFTGKLRLLSVKLETRKTAERTTPLIAAEALLEEHLYRQAMNKYIKIADSFFNSSFSADALLKAYEIAALYLDETSDIRESRTSEIKKRIMRHTNFPYHNRIREIDAESLWMDNNFSGALKIAEALLDADSSNDILLRLIGSARKPLPEKEARLLIQLIRKMKNLRCLDISGLGLESVLDLQGMKLHYLNCSGNKLKDLTGLETMPLQVLVTDNGTFSSPEVIRQEIRRSMENGGE